MYFCSSIVFLPLHLGLSFDFFHLRYASYARGHPLIFFPFFQIHILCFSCLVFISLTLTCVSWLETTVKQIEEAFKEFTTREDIAIVLISQYVSSFAYQIPIYEFPCYSSFSQLIDYLSL